MFVPPCEPNQKNMCLYPKLMKNPRYKPNKKNGGIVPDCVDERMEYVPVGCGNCIECRKQKARGWQVRLNEELKVNKYAYFVTMTFTNDALITLCKELQQGECNAVAALAVRRFLERWRKKYGKSVKHWFITELGHQGTERIHLHGLIITDKEITEEEYTNIWKYGRVGFGEYCNEKTINYIVKYVTKIDTDHKNYKSEIFCSAGLGKSYVENEFYKSIYKFKRGKTREYYQLNDGRRVNLPIYYRNKFYDEQTRIEMWRDKLDKNTIYANGIKCDKINTQKGYKNYINVLAQAQKENEEMGYGNWGEEWKEKEYNITLKMLNRTPTDNQQDTKKIKKNA